MRGLPLIILLLIPAMIALGHDAYLFYVNHAQGPAPISLDMIIEKFKFSALGFIWTTYDVESYKLAVSSMSEDDWSIIDHILTYKAFFVGLGFAALFIVPFSIMALFGKGPLSGSGNTIGSSPTKSKKGEKFKYNRK